MNREIPIEPKINRYMGDTNYYCGNCGHYLTDDMFAIHDQYCPRCKQKIGWNIVAVDDHEHSGLIEE